MFLTFPGEDALKKQSARRFSSPIFNVVVQPVDKPNRELGNVRFLSKNELLMSYIEKSKSPV